MNAQVLGAVGGGGAVHRGELWFDMRSRSRRLVPELAGTFGIGSVVAAIVLPRWIGGVGRRVCGWWFGSCVLRRSRMRARRCSAPTAARHPVAQRLAQVAALPAVVAAWGSTPCRSLRWSRSLAVAMFNVVAVRGPVRRAVVIGMQQMAFGIGVVVVTAVAVLA